MIAVEVLVRCRVAQQRTPIPAPERSKNAILRRFRVQRVSSSAFVCQQPNSWRAVGQKARVEKHRLHWGADFTRHVVSAGANSAKNAVLTCTPDEQDETKYTECLPFAQEFSLGIFRILSPPRWLWARVCEGYRIRNA